MLRLLFKRSDLIRHTGASPAHLSHWLRIGLLVSEVKDTRGSGDHRQFSTVNVIETAQAVEMTRVHLTGAHMRLLMMAQRAQLSKVPSSRRAAAAWTNYVNQAQTNAELLGDPRYRAWARELATTRVEKDAPETQ